MKHLQFPTLLLTLSLLSFGTARSQDLAALQSKLTVDCKSIRGHASRIAAEASAAEFNQAVAMAHLEQVVKFHTSMENDLKATSAIMTAAQQKHVAFEMKSLSQICKAIGQSIDDLQGEFAVSAPKQSTIKRIATNMKNEMNEGYDIHERMKRKLGII